MPVTTDRYITDIRKVQKGFLCEVMPVREILFLYNVHIAFRELFDASSHQNVP